MRFGSKDVQPVLLQIVHQNYLEARVQRQTAGTDYKMEMMGVGLGYPTGIAGSHGRMKSAHWFQTSKWYC